MKKLASILLVAGLATGTSSAFADGTVNGAALANFVGTGSNPTITLQITASGAPTAVGHTIGYGNINSNAYKFIPATWSSLNIYDQNNNYYGNFTVDSSNNTTLVLKNGSYSASSGYFICGISVVYNQTMNNLNYYFVKAAKICTPDIPNCSC